MTDISLRYLLFGEDKSASKTMHNVETSATRSGKVVGSSFSKMGSMIGGEVGELLARAGEGITGLAEAAKGVGPKLAATGTAVAGLGAALSMVGSKDKEAQSSLQAALAATGNSIDDFKEEIEDAVKHNENFGFSAADTQQALAQMTEALGDPRKALEQMGVVADLAAAKHVKLAGAADMLARGINGSTKVFKQYGIDIQSTSSATSALDKAETNLKQAQDARKTASDALAAVQKKVAAGTLTGAAADAKLKAAHKELASASDKVRADQLKLKQAHEAVKSATESTEDAVSQLGKKLAGQASASVDSFGGKLRVLKTKISDNVAEFGNKFGPALQITGVSIAAVGMIMQVMATKQLALAVATEAETVATTEQATASKAAAAAQWLLNAAMDANPLGLIIIGIVALVAAFVLLWQHSETFRTIVTAAFHAVQVAASFAINFIKEHWKLILAILGGPFIAAAIIIISNWHRISGAASDTISAIKTGWNAFIGFFKGLPGKIDRVASGMWNGITDGFKAALNGVIDIWNSMPSFKIPGFSVAGHHIGGGSIGLPHLNHLATGGILTSSGDVIVGEHGRERLSLPAGAQVRPLHASDDGTAGGNQDLGTFTLDLRQDGRSVQKVLLKLKREQGGLALGLA